MDNLLPATILVAALTTPDNLTKDQFISTSSKTIYHHSKQPLKNDFLHSNDVTPILWPSLDPLQPNKNTRDVNRQLKNDFLHSKWRHTYFQVKTQRGWRQKGSYGCRATEATGNGGQNNSRRLQHVHHVHRIWDRRHWSLWRWRRWSR